jgi:catechol 2,3-dioxygenase-like lactoylglutathione lyase family enzyme
MAAVVCGTQEIGYVMADQPEESEPTMRFTVDRIDHIVLNVKDVEITTAWYMRALGMEREEFGPNNRTALRFGGQKINVRPTDATPGTWPTGVNHAPGSGDLCFITAAPPDEVISHLHECGVAILSGPVERAGALGPIRSVYCRDPDGNLVEVASYQPD